MFGVGEPQALAQPFYVFHDVNTQRTESAHRIARRADHRLNRHHIGKRCNAADAAEQVL